MKGIWEYFPRHSKTVNTKFSVMQAVLSTQLPKSPFHLLCSPLLVTLDTNAQGQRGRRERERRRMASHFLGGPINFLQRRRNSRSWWKIPVHKHDIKDVRR